MSHIQATLPGGCGVQNFYAFGTAGWYNDHEMKLGGANLGIACFIDTSECKKAYETLKSKFNIVFQSTVRKNANSGHKFFIVIYDGKVK